MLTRVVQNRALSQSAKRCTFKASELQKNLDPAAVTPPPDFHGDEFLGKLQFGSYLTPHMLHIDYENGKWGKPRIEASSNLSLHPASGCLHYGMQAYEGLKAYYQAEKDRYVMFRPDMHGRRFLQSTRAVALPDNFDPNELVELIRELIKVDKDFIPRNPNGALYIRPSHIATTTALGLAAPNDSKIFVMLTAVGPYFKTGLNPVDLLCDPRYVRAWPGGTGKVKCGGNYGPTVPVGKEAKETAGCSQVMWLFDDGHADGPLITEVDTMNFFLVWHRESDGKLELITPPLDEPEGSRQRDFILPGVTRDSLLHLARSWNEFEVTEKSIRWGEIKRAVNEGRVVEAFGSGTACVVQPIGRFLDRTDSEAGEWVTVPSEKQEFRQRFYDALVGIQIKAEDPPESNWIVEC